MDIWMYKSTPPIRLHYVVLNKLSTGQVKVKVTLRLTVSRPVSLGVGRLSGTRDQFFFLLEIFF
jgi:hypothetical protein